MAEQPRAKLKPTLERVTTIQQDGSRNFLRPADVSGRYTLARRFSAILLIAVYVLAPWIKINGNPAIFLDVASRRFHLFGYTLATEDLWFLFFVLTGTGFLLFFVTAVLGRIWCGWACPQTVFLDHVYRRVERWIEGPASRQKELDQRPWDADKVLRRVSKHLIFILFSAVVAHIFLSYFISVDTLFAWMSGNPLEHAGAFFFMVAFTGILYFNFSWFREQLCLIICPYGRLQSALIDEHSMIIGYDEQRGEPRGKASDPENGDCIACNRCVEVCPTGIDIRQGLQMECIGCSNCIDACDAIMDRVGRPRGLIRYDSLEGFAGRKTRWLRPRVFLYFFLLLLGAGVMAYSSTKLQPVSVTVSRMTGTPFFVEPETIRNQLYVRLISKQAEPVAVEVRAVAPEGMNLVTAGFADAILLEPFEETRRPFILLVSRDDYTGPFSVTIRVTGSDNAFVVERQVDFIGPDPRLLRDDRRKLN